MRNLIRFVGCGLALALLIAACNMGFGTSVREATSPAAGPEAGEPLTGAAVSVPTISTRLLSALNAEYSPSGGELGAQAILFATSVELELFQNGEGPIESWLISDEDGLTTLEDFPPRLETFLEIEAGDGYTLTAAVFNAKVSSENPVVSGESEQFTVEAGASTAVSIVAVPFDPHELTGDGQSFALSIAQTSYEFVDDEGMSDIIITGIGGEAWFELGLTGGEDLFGRIVADPGGTADAVVLFYDEEGRILEDGDINDPPPWSWGYFPSALGGRGGTRAGFIGDLSEDVDVFMGALLPNRHGQTSEADLQLRLDILERPQPVEPYSNALPISEEPAPEDFLPLSTGDEVTQTIFDDGEPMVHWFLLENIGWGAEELMDPLPITVTITLDVLESGHVVGFEGSQYNGEPDMEELRLVVLVGESEGETTPDVYTALDDPDFEVTEHADGSTTLQFTVDAASEERDVAAIAVASRYAGNRFTVSWSAPGGAVVGIE